MSRTTAAMTPTSPPARSTPPSDRSGVGPSGPPAGDGSRTDAWAAWRGGLGAVGVLMSGERLSGGPGCPVGRAAARSEEAGPTRSAGLRTGPGRLPRAARGRATRTVGIPIGPRPPPVRMLTTGNRGALSNDYPDVRFPPTFSERHLRPPRPEPGRRPRSWRAAPIVRSRPPPPARPRPPARARPRKDHSPPT